ncbi:MAG TPA: response regulator [Gammaproteobacteria bacterium]|nr:response regulator [Gammaproteobacteria bacterium]
MNAQAIESGKPSGTVYVVDDDDAVRDGVSLLLQAFGWPVESFASAGAFLDSYVPRDRQCLVLDLHMPGMHGAELEEQLRAHGNDIPVIIVTAYKEDPLIRRARAAGAKRVLTKPFNDAELIESIETALGARDDSGAGEVPSGAAASRAP